MKTAPFLAPSVDQISADRLLTAASPFRDSLLFVTHGVCLLVRETGTEYQQMSWYQPATYQHLLSYQQPVDRYSTALRHAEPGGPATPNVS